ncbi:unnamed protein product [Penicillium salamii]|uniref:Uncharacterized protein n=1 Tax=Penicillium salamii TaxID=1612424 RepID=A0A9W4IYY6_9EURO|nr:unnamed protein product [Penicillium salamii]CAG8164767.1 unnamed protein product [Penicillium salamii]CAG8358967.1 unnamed protein product [Penicillium salamii]CAG8365288.1 unnamed protein product [Penicillium salamii]CAG8367634.1 unnamed protein product [Penicillium salamii]
MGENAKAEITQAERDNRWGMAYKARMRQIVPGLLGNVEASYKRQMLQNNRINAIVSLTSARFAWWRSTTRTAGIHKWIQCADSSTQDHLVYMSYICDSIDQWQPQLFRHYPHCLPSATLRRTTSDLIRLQRRY